MASITVNVDPTQLTRELSGRTGMCGVTLSIDPYELVTGPLTFNADGLATIHNSDFMREERFASAYAAGQRTGSWGDQSVHWRAHIACWAADKAKDLEGDFVECGVNRGGLSMTIIQYVGFANLSKNFWLLDTFQGLDTRFLTEAERANGIHQLHYDECYESVRKTFGDFPNVKIVRGSVPDTLPQVTAEKVSFLSIDMNCVAPEIAAADYFWDKLVSGGVMLLDDYGWAQHIEQKRAFDAWSKAKNVPILGLPTGQALIFKP